jgi:5'-methylthioadenosine phosphorylase
VLKAAIRRIDGPRECPCASALENALMTAPGLVPAEVKKELAPIVGKYLR